MWGERDDRKTIAEERMIPSAQAIKKYDPTPKTQKVDRILVVNDVDDICTFISYILSNAGYTCVTARDGVEALALLESGEKFDVLLSNLRMPRLDGNALLERTRDKFPDLPFVMESGTGDVSLLCAAVRNGAFAYLHSPFERRELLGVVRRALEYRQMRCK